jgi:hypothetical protein
MKHSFLLAIICCYMLPLQAQDKRQDTTGRAVPREQCPQELLQYLNNDLLKTKAVLLLFNESLHPLGRHEFYDAGAPVRYLHIPIRMNRCTLMYIDTGLHLFHTMYQQLKEPVYFSPGKIYMARLFTRTVWPIGGISVIKKNEKGEKEEYVAVLLEYINAAQATELLNKMKKKEVLVNE